MHDVILTLDLPAALEPRVELRDAVRANGGIIQFTAINGHTWSQADRRRIEHVGEDPDTVRALRCHIYIPTIAEIHRHNQGEDHRHRRVLGSIQAASDAWNHLHELWESFSLRFGAASQPRSRQRLLREWRNLVTRRNEFTQGAGELGDAIAALVDDHIVEDAPVPDNPEVPAAGSAPAPETHYQQYMRNRELYGGMEGRRQREAAEQRLARTEQERQAALEKVFPINWYATDVWSTPANDGTDQIWHYPINQMEDQHLWNTIIWLVRGCLSLYQLYVPHTNRNCGVGLSARTWLVQQPIFRALLAEAIKRQLTFPQDVFTYLRQYALTKHDNSVRETRPWKDPGASYQQGQLDDFLHQAIVTEMGKDLRNIDIGE